MTSFNSICRVSLWPGAPVALRASPANAADIFQGKSLVRSCAIQAEAPWFDFGGEHSATMRKSILRAGRFYSFLLFFFFFLSGASSVKAIAQPLPKVFAQEKASGDSKQKTIDAANDGGKSGLLVSKKGDDLEDTVGAEIHRKERLSFLAELAIAFVDGLVTVAILIWALKQIFGDNK
jgi:hypothetical protein